MLHGGAAARLGTVCVLCAVLSATPPNTGHSTQNISRYAATPPHTKNDLIFTES